MGVTVAPPAGKAHFNAKYVTVKGVDVALIELGRTIAEMQKEGIEPLPLAEVAPAAGASIEMVGLPFERGDRQAERQVRRARCAEGTRRPDVVEHSSYWYDLHVNDCAALGLGATGSPMIDQSGRVYGVFSTRLDASEAQQPCYIGAPCEIGASGERGARGTSYVTDATTFSKCFNAQGELDLSVTGCQLDPGIGEYPGRLPRIVTPTYGEPPLPTTWKVTFDGARATHFRYKVGPAGSVDCRAPGDYSEPLPIANGLTGVAVPQQPGLYALCLLTGSGEAGGPEWQAFEHPTVVVEKVLAGAEVDPKATLITAEQWFGFGQELLEIYRDVATAHDARFQIEYGSVATPDVVTAPDRTWTVRVGWDQREGLSADVGAFILCHELGHALGGFPFKDSSRAQATGMVSGQYGTVVSAEGNADYFAAKECLPRLWANQRPLNETFAQTASDYARARCDEVWQGVDERNLCYRTLAMAEPFASWSGGKDSSSSFHLDTPDPLVVSAISVAHPHLQCRVDTILQGALCRVKFRGTEIPGLIPPYDALINNPPASEAAAAPNSCVEGLGARPACWFIQNTPQPPDCMGAPELGECATLDGRSVIRTCFPGRGLVVEKCTEPQVCLSDDSGAYCGAPTPSEPENPQP